MPRTPSPEDFRARPSFACASSARRDVFDVFDFSSNAPKNKKRDVSKKSNALSFIRPPYVGALAFGFFISPYCFATAPTWAQTPVDILSPLTLNRQAEIDATRFSSGIYGDPAPNAPSPFVGTPTSTPLPPFFSGDAADAVPNAAREQLEALAWAVGCWELESAGFIFQTKIDWAPGGSYLLCRDFVRPSVAPTSASSLAQKNDAASTEPTAKFAALRVIGWNPVAGLFQSTIFCRDGSYGSGLWQREGESWRVATRILLVDGRAATSVEYFSPRPSGGFDWESTSRTVENTPLPNVGPATTRPLNPRLFESLEKSMFSDLPSPQTPTTQSEFE
ncbi:MAG: hypothetical protein IJE97_04225 [Thermoguttaceae bacterium]|nr:hypothetical protein [Thermoguttaceae bacterium]MBQ7112518.1 hypothetical protein [Thermoguttaceae bacterium]